jgi:hypothetical protein
MEVHHHPDLHHKRKKFREYLLEFVMIFLAVTMGFLAENIREHVSDKEKEREYINSLIGNLKEDTAGIDKVIRDNEYKRDTLRLLLGLARRTSMYGGPWNRAWPRRRPSNMRSTPMKPIGMAEDMRGTCCPC